MFRILKIVWACNRRRFVKKIVYTFFTSTLPLVNLYLLKILIDNVTAAATGGESQSVGMYGSALFTCVLLFCGVSLLNRLVTIASNVNNDLLSQNLVDHINGLIQNQSASLDMSFYDDPHFYDTFHRAQQEAAYRPLRIVDNLAGILGSALSLIGIGVILLYESWQVVAVMFVAAIPSFVIKLYKAQRMYRFRRDTTNDARRGSYYGQLLSNKISAKEVRTLGLAPMLRQRYKEVRKQLVGRLTIISKRMACIDAVASTTEAAALALAIVLLLRPVAGGVMTIGSFVMLFEAFRRGQGYMSSMVVGVGGMYENKLFISNLFEFLTLSPSVVSPDSPVGFPEEIKSVELRNVTFTYPDMKTPVLKDVDFIARRGEVTRISGANGIGKTTMLKLMLRLYDPDEGAVYINGIDIRRFDLRELRRNMSVLFQDYMHYCFTAVENVAIGDVFSEVDRDRVDEALRLSGADTVVDSLHNGLDTMLGRQFDDGEELSMGQWQRMALARQLYSNAPVMLFDEPTAWMDTTSRNKFYTILESLKHNRVVVLVTHLDD